MKGYNHIMNTNNIIFPNYKNKKKKTTVCPSTTTAAITTLLWETSNRNRLDCNVSILQRIWSSNRNVKKKQIHILMNH